MVGNIPSTPSAVVFSPSSAALARPGESATTPTIHTGSISSLRMAFINRSVPMFPGPMIAAFTFLLMLVLFYDAAKYSYMHFNAALMPGQGYRTRYKHFHVRSSSAVHGLARSGNPARHQRLLSRQSLVNVSLGLEGCEVKLPLKTVRGRTPSSSPHGRVYGGS